MKENRRGRWEIVELERHLSKRGVTEMGNLLSKPASDSPEKQNPDPSLLRGVKTLECCPLLHLRRRAFVNEAVTRRRRTRLDLQVDKSSSGRSGMAGGEEVR